MQGFTHEFLSASDATGNTSMFWSVIVDTPSLNDKSSFHGSTKDVQ